MLGVAAVGGSDRGKKQRAIAAAKINVVVVESRRIRLNLNIGASDNPAEENLAYTQLEFLQRTPGCETITLPVIQWR